MTCERCFNFIIITLLFRFQDLLPRYEEPDVKNRWDRPLVHYEFEIPESTLPSPSPPIPSSQPQTTPTSSSSSFRRVAKRSTEPSSSSSFSFGGRRGKLTEEMVEAMNKNEDEKNDFFPSSLDGGSPRSDGSLSSIDNNISMRCENEDEEEEENVVSSFNPTKTTFNRQKRRKREDEYIKEFWVKKQPSPPPTEEGKEREGEEDEICELIASIITQSPPPPSYAGISQTAIVNEDVLSHLESVI